MINYTLPLVILHNVTRSRRQYFGYVSASAFAVATFFSFGFFLLHPTLQAKLSSDVSSALAQLLLVGQIGVAIFAVFFVLFFHRFLLRLRAHEFGLWTILGISPRQLQRMVRIESVFLATIAITIGLLLSFVETAVLFHILNRPLDIPALDLRFEPAAIYYGLAFFTALFGVDAYTSAHSLRKLTPKILLNTTKTGQGSVRISRWRLVVGVGAIIVSYALALGFQGASAGVSSANILPIVILISIGTYFVINQGLVFVLTHMRKKALSGLALISVSRLTHRVRDFAKVLTVVSLLQAGVLTLIGVALGIFSHLHQMATSDNELRMFIQLFSIVMFVFLFLAFLFFGAALSTLWAKLFTQVDEDRHQFRGLQRIGLSHNETRSIIKRELAVLFLVPTIIAVLHATVAMGEFTTKIAPKDLSNQDTWIYFGYLSLCYVGLSLINLTIACWRYTKSLA